MSQKTTITEPPGSLVLEALEKLRVVEGNIATLRLFLAKHGEKLNGENFYASPDRPKEPWINVYSCDGPKAFARRFGGVAWKREADSYKCGKFDWLTEIDGVGIKIDGAELISPKFVEQVRL